jgi:hypothetical protein
MGARAAACRAGGPASSGRAAHAHGAAAGRRTRGLRAGCGARACGGGALLVRGACAYAPAAASRAPDAPRRRPRAPCTRRPRLRRSRSPRTCVRRPAQLPALPGVEPRMRRVLCALLAALTQRRRRRAPQGLSELTGTVSDCCCEYETLDALNQASGECRAVSVRCAASARECARSARTPRLRGVARGRACAAGRLCCGTRLQARLTRVRVCAGGAAPLAVEPGEATLLPLLQGQLVLRLPVLVRWRRGARMYPCLER